MAKHLHIWVNKSYTSVFFENNIQPFWALNAYIFLSRSIWTIFFFHFWIPYWILYKIPKLEKIGRYIAIHIIVVCIKKKSIPPLCNTKYQYFIEILALQNWPVTFFLTQFGYFFFDNRIPDRILYKIEKYKKICWYITICVRLP